MSRGIDVQVISDDPGGFDEYGDPVASTGEARTVSGCFVAPVAKDPETSARGREGELRSVDLVAPPGSGINRHDRIIVPLSDPSSGTYEVSEPVTEWISKSGVNRGSVVALKRAVG